MASLQDRDLIELADRAFEHGLITGIEHADSHIVIWQGSWTVELSPAGAHQYLGLLVRGYEQAQGKGRKAVT